ncbi:MAG: NUDIX hydrolase [Candidatus Micrarchaeia archaeon]
MDILSKFLIQFKKTPEHDATQIRRRGTAIVVTKQGILLTAQKRKIFSLPGGGAHSKESRIHAAIRELREETGLCADNVRFLFRYQGSIHVLPNGTQYRDFHTVCLVHARGVPIPKKEIKYLFFLRFGSNPKIRTNDDTKHILEKFEKEMPQG